jgi:hypothetical protein
MNTRTKRLADYRTPDEASTEAPLPYQGVQNTTEKLLGEFLTQEDAAAELNICERTLDRWRSLGEGPPITRLGRRILYRRSSLQAWLCTCEHCTQHDKAGETSTGRRRRTGA